MRDFVLILPEVFLALTVGLLLIGEVSYHGERVRLSGPTALIGLAGALVQTLIGYRYGATEVFGNTAAIDGLTQFFRLIFIVLAMMTLVSSSHTREIPEKRQADYQILVILSALAMCWLAAATDLVLAFCALQLMNITNFFIAGYARDSKRSNEAALKYMILGSVAGALLIYGFGILFLQGGVANIRDLNQLFASGATGGSNTLLVGFILIFVAITFQLAAFPMNLWAADVIEGAPTPSGAFILAGSRAAGFALAIRLLLTLFTKRVDVADTTAWQPLGNLSWNAIVGVVAAASMLIGPFLALRQTSVKRMISCLCVGTTGQLLIGLLVLDIAGLSALLYGVIVEVFALCGIFYVFSIFYEQFKSDQLNDFRGVLRRATPECVALILFLLCFIGMPPTPGFFAKFAIVEVAVRHHHLVLGIVAVLSWTLSAVTVAKLSFRLVGDFSDADAPAIGASLPRKVFLGTLLLPIFIAAIFAEPILRWTGKSLGTIFW